MPCKPKRYRKDISSALLRYYDKACELMEKRKFLAVAALDSAKLFVFAGREIGWFHSVLCLRVSDSGLAAYEGKVSSSKVYSAFVRNDGASVAIHLVKHGRKLENVKDILGELEWFEVDVNALPDEVASELALAKLLGD